MKKCNGEPKRKDEIGMSVCHALIIDGIAFNAFDKAKEGGVRSLIETLGACSISRTLLSSLIPHVRDCEMDRLHEELKNIKHLSFSFDSTPNVGYVNNHNVITQRAVNLQTFKKSGTGNEIFLRTFKVLSDTFGFKTDSLISCTRDGAESNTVATSNWSRVCPSLLDVICISHSVNLIGKELEISCPTAFTFSRKWSHMVQISDIAKNMFHILANTYPKSISETRWYSAWEVAMQIRENWDAVLAVIASPESFCEESRVEMKTLLTTNMVQLKLELALMKDVGDCLVVLCYEQEGDGEMLIKCGCETSDESQI